MWRFCLLSAVEITPGSVGRHATDIGLNLQNGAQYTFHQHSRALQRGLSLPGTCGGIPPKKLATAPQAAGSPPFCSN